MHAEAPRAPSPQVRRQPGRAGCRIRCRSSRSAANPQDRQAIVPPRQGAQSRPFSVALFSAFSGFALWRAVAAAQRFRRDHRGKKLSSPLIVTPATRTAPRRCLRVGSIACPLLEDALGALVQTQKIIAQGRGGKYL